MKDLTLSQQYALLALDGQESIHPSVAKSAVLRAVSAAQVLETELGKADADSFSERKKRRLRLRKKLLLFWKQKNF